MGLKHQCRNVFLALRSGLGNEYIAGFVGFAGQGTTCGELLQPGGHGAFVTGLARDAGYFLENTEDRCRIHNKHIISCKYSNKSDKNV